MTKKIGVLTFHASHNFGSMLQAFALQKILEQIGYASEIINFRSVVQRKNFSGVWHLRVNSIYALMRKCVLFPWRQDFITKYNKFENFLQNNLVHTAQYNTEEEVLEKSPKYDFYIAGSDQIWNSTAMDFSWLYFLPFKTGKKIAYAPSAGDQALLPQNKEKCLIYYPNLTLLACGKQN